MRNKWWLLGVAVFFIVLSGSFWKRVLALSLSTVLGTTSPAGWLLTNGGSSAATATPPPIQIADLFRNDNTNPLPSQPETEIFNRPPQPSSESSGTGVDIFSNPDTVPEPSSPPNLPKPRPAESSNHPVMTFKSPKARKLSPDKFEITLYSDAGCNFTTLVRVNGTQVQQESIRFTPSSLETCGLPAFTARLQSGGSQMEIQVDGTSGLLVLNKLDETFIRVSYRDSGQTKDLGTIRLPQNRVKAQKQSKIPNKDVKGICDAAKSACSWLGYISGSAGLVEFTGAFLGLALAPPAAAAFGAFMAASAVAGFGCWFMFGGFPPLSWSRGNSTSAIREMLEGASIGYGFSSGFGGMLDGLSGMTEWQDKKLKCIRGYLSNFTHIPFNTCDRAESNQNPIQAEGDCDTEDDEQTTATLPIPSQPKGPLRQGRSYGDPHIVTFDGYRYSFQTVGEFVLVQAKDGGFRVQVRQGAVPGRQLSLNTAVAMQVGNSRVAVYSKDFPDGNASTPVWIDGRPTPVQGTVELSGGSIQGGNGNYLVQWQTGEQVGISKLSVAGMEFMNVTPAVPEQAGRYEGLLGDLDNNPENDLQTRDGQVILTRDNSTYGVLKQALGNLGSIPIPLNQLETAFFEQLYQKFGNSWRVSQPESLFAYGIGQSTESFTNRGFPSSFSTLGSLLPPQLRQAEEICRQAGVPGDLLEGCIFDVGNTGEGGFAQAALNTVLDQVKNRVESEIRNRIPVPMPIPLPF
jgi:hypothetical protein